MKLRILYLLAACVIVIVSSALLFVDYREKSLYEQTARDIASTSPPMATPARQEEDAFRRVIKENIVSQRKGLNESMRLERIRKVMAEVMSRRLAQASDEVLVDYLSLLIDQLRVLKARKDDHCFRFLYADVEGGINIRESFSPALLQRHITLQNRILKSSETPRELPSFDDVAPQLDHTHSYLESVFGSDIKLLEAPDSPDADRAKICEMITELYLFIEAAPHDVKLSLLRWIFSSQGKNMNKQDAHY